MGAQLLLLPLLFVFICISFLILQRFYLRWKMKELMVKKREAAKISLVNIMHLTNSTLMAPSWPRCENPEGISTSAEPTDKNGLPSYNQLVAGDCACGGEALCMGPMSPHNPNVLSSVVTLREEQESPPPYEDLYDAKGKPQFQSVLFSYQNSCSGLVMPVLSQSSSEQTSCNSTMDVQKMGGEGGSKLDGRDFNSFSQNRTCLLQIPSQSAQLEPDPSLERRNSSAVLYL